MRQMLVIITLLVGLLLAGCTGEDQVPQTGGAFIGGTTGLEASFEQFSVKEEGVYSIFDTEDFPIDIALKNKGEETLTPGQVTLRLLGPSKEDFVNIVPATWQTTNVEEIDKISEFNPTGGEEIVSFTPDTRAQYNGKVTGFTDINWNLEYWYDYKTHVIVNDVCFKGDITDDKICNVKGTRTFSVSAAPITIKSVEEDTSGKGIIMLRFQVENAGTGKSTTTGGEFDTRFDQIAFSIDEPEKWECKSGGRENEGRLIDGKADITCRSKQPLLEEDLYTRSVRLTLDYTYKNLVQEKLRIKESVK